MLRDNIKSFLFLLLALVLIFGIVYLTRGQTTMEFQSEVLEVDFSWGHNQRGECTSLGIRIVSRDNTDNRLYIHGTDMTWGTGLYGDGPIHIKPNQAWFVSLYPWAYDMEPFGVISGPAEIYIHNLTGSIFYRNELECE